MRIVLESGNPGSLARDIRPSVLQQTTATVACVTVCCGGVERRSEAVAGGVCDGGVPCPQSELATQVPLVSRRHFVLLCPGQSVRGVIEEEPGCWRAGAARLHPPCVQRGGGLWEPTPAHAHRLFVASQILAEFLEQQ